MFNFVAALDRRLMKNDQQIYMYQYTVMVGDQDAPFNIRSGGGGGGGLPYKSDGGQLQLRTF